MDLLRWQARDTNEKFMLKTVGKLVTEYLSEDLTKVNAIHTHNLRVTQSNLFMPKPHTKALRMSFRQRAWSSYTEQANLNIERNRFCYTIDI